MATKKTKPTTAKKTTSPKKTSPKPAKKVTPKKSTSPDVVESSEPVKTTSSTTRSSRPALKVRKLYITLVLLLIALVGLAVYFKSLFVVALVNGQPILTCIPPSHQCKKRMTKL